jgi:hypothetical protein
LDSIAKAKLAAIALAVPVLLLAASLPAAGQDLHAQSAAALLERGFTDPDLSYLLLDEDGQIIAQRWDGPEGEIPVGSLMKPFLAVAYGRTHQSFPVFRCTGKKTCWLPRGHGTLHIREAIAFSCNSYFHQLVAQGGRNFRPALESLHLQPTSNSGGEPSLTMASPLALAQAYLELTRRSREPAVSPVLQGMALSAQKGTAKAMAADLGAASALAKTGTAPCTHRKKAPGDGLALVMTPADHPRSVLLVRLHGRPGFIAAGLAGRMVARMEGSGVQR